MTLLVISPDYASHLLPLATLASAWRDAGERVVVGVYRFEEEKEEEEDAQDKDKDKDKAEAPR